ncbi:MAG: rod shape-determining protein MreD [Paenibacillaceae bacterium ZCTH02-B3]|nr:MAG: rod shape-determining protein MreD [Paenibacillaceae bacterium ZCTH02-B3]
MKLRVHRTILAALFLLLIETAVLPWLVPAAMGGRIVPHFPFLVTLFVAVTAGRHTAFFFGLGFGLFQDVVFYGHLIGAYAFGMALAGYLAGLLVGRLRPSAGLYIVLTAFGGFMLDTIVYAIYRLFQVTTVSYLFAIGWQILPTTAVQAALAALFYFPFRRLLTRPAPAASQGSGERSSAD